MINDNLIEKLTPSQYKEGILDICDFLRLEMIYFLEKEGRYYGRVKSYMNDIYSAMSRMNQKVTEDDIQTYGRILYLLRPQIYHDFKRLGKKKLSNADRIIIIMRKLIEYSGKFEPNTPFRFSKETNTVLKTLNKMFENIRNKGKEDSLYSLKDLIENTIYSGSLGKYCCDRLDLISIAEPKEKERTIKKEVQEQIFSSPKKDEISFL